MHFYTVCTQCQGIRVLVYSETIINICIDLLCNFQKDNHNKVESLLQPLRGWPLCIKNYNAINTWFRYNRSSLRVEVRNTRNTHFNSAWNTWLGQKDLFHHIQIPNFQVTNILFYLKTRKLTKWQLNFISIKELYRVLLYLACKPCAGQKSKGTKLIKSRSGYTLWQHTLKITSQSSG